MKTHPSKHSSTSIQPAKARLTTSSASFRKWAATALLATATFACQAADAPAVVESGKRFLPWEKGWIKFDDFKGSLLDANVALEYRPWKHIGFGLGYNSMSVHVEAESDNSNYPCADFVGDVGVRFGGLMLYGKFSI
jgi:hypothetical protein